MEEELEQENRKKKKLPIPANVSDRQEFFVGFGVEELKIVGIGAAIGAVIAMMIYCITKEFIAPFFTLLIIVYCSYMLSYRNKYGENMVEKIKYFKEFCKQQKIYIYEYVPLVAYKEEKKQEGEDE